MKELLGEFKFSIIAVAVAVVLGAVVFAVSIVAPSGDIIEPPVAPGILYSDIGELTIATSRGEFVFERSETNQSWAIRKPIDWAARKVILDKIIERFLNFDPEARLSPESRKDFGLDSPSYTVSLADGGGAVTTFRIGARTPDKRKVYVEVEGKTDVYIANAAILGSLMPDMKYYLDTSPVTTNVSLLNELEIATGNHRIKVFETRGEGGKKPLWRFEGIEGVVVSTEKLNNFLAEIIAIKILAFEDGSKTPSGFEKPRASLVFSGKGFSEELLIGDPVMHEGEICTWARRTDYKTAFILPASIIEILDAYNYEGLKDNRYPAVEFDMRFKKIEITTPAEYFLAHVVEDDPDKAIEIEKPVEIAAGPQEIIDLAFWFPTLEVSKLLSLESHNLEDYGLGRQQKNIRLDIVWEDVEREPLELVLSKLGRSVYVYREGYGQFGEVVEEHAGVYDWLSTPYLNLRTRYEHSILRLPAENPKLLPNFEKMTFIDESGDVFEVLHKATTVGGFWYLDGEDLPGDLKDALTARAGVYMLRFPFETFEGEFEDLSPFGLDKPILQLGFEYYEVDERGEIDKEAGLTKRFLKIGGKVGRGPDASYYVTYDDHMVATLPNREKYPVIDSFLLLLEQLKKIRRNK